MLKMVKKWWEKQPWAKKTEPKRESKIVYDDIKLFEKSPYEVKKIADYMLLGLESGNDYYWQGQYYPVPEIYMTQSKWEKMGRVGFGDRHFQEYSLDEREYVYILTNDDRPQFPEHIPYIVETLEVIGTVNKGTIFKMALAE